VDTYHNGKLQPNREGWAAVYRAQIAAAESMRERAVERLDKLIDDAARGR